MGDDAADQGKSSKGVAPQEEAQVHMHRWDWLTLVIAEQADRTGEINGIPESDHPVLVGQRVDLHRLDVRNYGRLPERKRECPFTDDQCQLDRPTRPPVKLRRGDGVEEMQTARSEPRWMSESAIGQRPLVIVAEVDYPIREFGGEAGQPH